MRRAEIEWATYQGRWLAAAQMFRRIDWPEFNTWSTLVFDSLDDAYTIDNIKIGFSEDWEEAHAENEAFDLARIANINHQQIRKSGRRL